MPESLWRVLQPLCFERKRVIQTAYPLIEFEPCLWWSHSHVTSNRCWSLFIHFLGVHLKSGEDVYTQFMVRLDHMYLAHFSDSEIISIKMGRMCFLRQFLSCTPAFWCIEVHLHSPFLCSSAPMALSCEFTGRHSHTDECVSVKRAGMAVTSPGTAEKQTNPPPPAPLRKLAQAPPIGHKHYRVRSTNSPQKS